MRSEKVFEALIAGKILNFDHKFQMICLEYKKCGRTYQISCCRELGKCSACEVLALRAQGPELTPGTHIKMPGVVTCTCNPSQEPPCIEEKKQTASNY